MQIRVGGRVQSLFFSGQFWEELCLTQSSRWNQGPAVSSIVSLCCSSLLPWLTLPVPSLLLPGLTFQIKHLHSSPYLRLSSPRIPQQDSCSDRHFTAVFLEEYNILKIDQPLVAKSLIVTDIGTRLTRFDGIKRVALVVQYSVCATPNPKLMVLGIFF